jgi:hypothetical protein
MGFVREGVEKGGGSKGTAEKSKEMEFFGMS